jgi:hypothetical protein
MTKFWGPLGWMMLHSISVNYPKNPTAEDMAILDKFISIFADCISCNNCKEHFKRMFTSYKKKYREWSSSQSQLFLFVCRAHNTVNNRLDKPILTSVSDCLETIKNNSKNISLREFRQKYIAYLVANWSAGRDFESFNTMRSVRELEKINNSYWNLREVDISTIELFEENVTEFIQDTTIPPPISPGFPVFSRNQNFNVGFKFKGGKLSLIGQ